MPNLTCIINVGPCEIHVHGKRSTSGWAVSFNGRLQGERKDKRKAIQLAIDCCEPGTRGTLKVEPKRKS